MPALPTFVVVGRVAQVSFLLLKACRVRIGRSGPGVGVDVAASRTLPGKKACNEPVESIQNRGWSFRRRRIGYQ